MVSELEQLPEVESVHPQGILQTVFVIGEDGKVIGGNGPPGLAFNYTGAESLTGKPILEVIDGDLPDGPDEIALDVDTVEKRLRPRRRDHPGHPGARRRPCGRR